MSYFNDPVAWLAWLFLSLLFFAVMEKFLPRAPPEPDPPPILHSLVFADGNTYDVAHSTVLWAYAGSFWKKATVTAFNEHSTDVMFAIPEGSFSVKRYSCGSWRFMPYDELQEPNFIPTNPAINAAKIKTLGDVHEQRNNIH